MATRQQRRANLARTQRRRFAQQRRQELARRRQGPGAATTTRRSRRGLWAGIVALAVVIAVVGAVLVIRDDTTVHHLLSKQVSSTSGDRTIDATPDTYKVVYRYEIHTTDGSIEAYTEEVTMSRPFEGRLLYKKGEPPGGERFFDVVSRFGAAAQYRATTGTTDSRIAPPDLALAEQRLDVTLPMLVDMGFFEPRERRVVAGRECVTYHTGSPIEDLSVTKPTATQYADLCIDRSGLILEEVAVRESKVAARLLALSVSVDEKLDEAFEVPPAPPTATGSNQLVDVAKTTSPAPAFVSLDAAPAGYEHKGRYRFLEDQNDPAAPPGTPQIAPKETFYDVYTKGRDVIIIRQGLQANESPIDDKLARPVALDAHPEAKVEAGLKGFTIAMHPEEWYIHVFGTRPVAELTAIANGLHL